MDLPHLSKDTAFKPSLAHYGLAYQGSIVSGQVTITNTAVFGLSEEELLRRFVAGVSHLVEKEKELETGAPDASPAAPGMGQPPAGMGPSPRSPHGHSYATSSQLEQVGCILPLGSRG